MLLTNAPLEYARAVLRRLGILRQFDSLWAIEHMRLHGEFRPKPSPALLRYVLAREGASPRRTVLVEDTLANLRARAPPACARFTSIIPARRSGRGRSQRPSYVDLRVNSVSDLLLRRRPLRG